MHVRTDSGIFDEPSPLRDILVLIEYFAEARHIWLIDLASVDAVAVSLTPRVPELAQTLELLTQKAWTDQYAWAAPGASTELPGVTVTHENLQAVTADLGRPGVVVVEDLVTDSCFLNAILQIVGDGSALEAIAAGWIEIRHSGGSGRVEAVSQAEHARFAVLPRVCCVIDSDALYPGHRTEAHAKAERLRTAGVGAHVLRSREAENYIPNEALATLRPFRESSRKLDSLKRLSPNQRAHYDMKRGFPGRVVPSEQQDLYSDLSPRLLRDLETGFGAAVIHCLREAAGTLKSDVFRSPQSELISELRDIVRLIESMV